MSSRGCLGRPRIGTGPFCPVTWTWTTGRQRPVLVRACPGRTPWPTPWPRCARDVRGDGRPVDPSPGRRSGPRRPTDAADGGAVPRPPFRERVVEGKRVLTLSRLLPWSHWITPEIMKHRFDTRFFLTTLPPGQDCSPDPDRDGPRGLAPPPGGPGRKPAGGDGPEPPHADDPPGDAPVWYQAGGTSWRPRGRAVSWGANPEYPKPRRRRQGPPTPPSWDPLYGPGGPPGCGRPGDPAPRTPLLPPRPSGGVLRPVR